MFNPLLDEAVCVRIDDEGPKLTKVVSSRSTDLAATTKALQTDVFEEIKYYLSQQDLSAAIDHTRFRHQLG